MASVDNALWLLNIVAEGTLFCVLLYRRAWRLFPVFTLYSFWSFASDLIWLLMYRRFPFFYVTAYLTDITIGSLIEIGVLIELAWSAFRPYRTSLPRATPVVLAALTLIVGAAIWPLTGLPELFHAPLQYSLLMRLRQDIAILRILFCLALAGCSQLLSIGWRDRELQIATGLGFYSLVSLAVEMIQSHLALGPAYSHLNRINIFSFILSLVYWTYCFTHKEAERRAFTPKMQSMLLFVAGSARSARITLTASGNSKSNGGKDL